MQHIIINENLPYYISLAQGLIVTHSEPVRISKEQGRGLYGFIHVLKGWIEYKFPEDGSTIQIHARQTVYVPKDCRYLCVYPSEDTTVAILNFDLLQESMQPIPQKPVLLSASAERRFRNFTDQHMSLNSLQCAARIYELLDLLLKAPPALPKKYRRLQPAIEHIEKFPILDNDVDFYAKLCEMSVPGFRRSFREYVGVSPIEYRNSLRLQYAKMLLTTGEYSVEEVAHKSGFNNISFFYRLFRRKFGSSPSKF